MRVHVRVTVPRDTFSYQIPYIHCFSTQRRHLLTHACAHTTLHSYLTGQLHLIPSPPISALLQHSKDVEERCEAVVLYRVDAKHVLPEKLYVAWQQIAHLSCQLLDWSK